MTARLQLSGIALAAASCCATSAFALRVDQEAIAIETARSAGTVRVRQTDYEFLNSGTNAVLTGAYNQFGTPAPSDSSSINVISGSTDRGKWLCDTCSDLGTTPVINLSADGPLVSFIKETVNLTVPLWRPNDSISICNGKVCVNLFYHAAGQWFPKPPRPIVKDDGRGYKNARTPSTSYVPLDRLATQVQATVLYVNEGTLIVNLDIYEDGPMVHWKREVNMEPPDPPPPPPPPPPGGGGGGGGGSCVHVDSLLPDGRRAGSIKVGDVIQLGNENSGNLETYVGQVTYSKKATMRGFRVVTQSGASLLCSDTAPIWTDEGFINAPDLLGKRVAVRRDEKGIVTRFETVEVLAEVGMMEVQHITVGDRAFWAGETMGAYILHHNKYVPEDGD